MEQILTHLGLPSGDPAQPPSDPANLFADTLA